MELPTPSRTPRALALGADHVEVPHIPPWRHGNSCRGWCPNCVPSRRWSRVPLLFTCICMWQEGHSSLQRTQHPMDETDISTSSSVKNCSTFTLVTPTPARQSRSRPGTRKGPPFPRNSGPSFVRALGGLNEPLQRCYANSFPRGGPLACGFVGFPEASASAWPSCNSSSTRLVTSPSTS